ncbi:MAG: IscA/HesB family protein [Desulfovibrio sp.]|nr:IscA/HesB family protein [Desulfovibrio sp.]
MLEISEDAKKELNEYFKDNEKGTIRIFLAPGGCSGPRLALALDEAGDDDMVEEIDGFKFCINKQLEDQIKSAKIDLTPMGFIVVPEVPLPDSGGSGCGGCCGGCGGA